MLQEYQTILARIKDQKAEFKPGYNERIELIRYPRDVLTVMTGNLTQEEFVHLQDQPHFIMLSKANFYIPYIEKIVKPFVWTYLARAV